MKIGPVRMSVQKWKFWALLNWFINTNAGAHGKAFGECKSFNTLFVLLCNASSVQSCLKLQKKKTSCIFHLLPSTLSLSLSPSLSLSLYTLHCTHSSLDFRRQIYILDFLLIRFEEPPPPFFPLLSHPPIFFTKIFIFAVWKCFGFRMGLRDCGGFRWEFGKFVVFSVCKLQAFSSLSSVTHQFLLWGSFLNNFQCFSSIRCTDFLTFSGPCITS